MEQNNKIKIEYGGGGRKRTEGHRTEVGHMREAPGKRARVQKEK